MAGPLKKSKKSKEEIAQAYSSEPWWYDIRGFFILTFSYRSTIWEQVGFFGNNMRSPHMEVAIGTGTLFDIILKWRKWKKREEPEIVGVDYAESMLKGAEARFGKYSNIELKHADVGDLPYPDDYFQTINIANAIHCFPDVDKSIAEVLRVLQPAGTLAINVLLYPKGNGFLDGISSRINRWGIKKGILVTPYDKKAIKEKLEQAGAVVKYEKVSGNTYNVLAEKLNS